VAGDEEAATGEKEEGDKKRTNCFYVGGSGGQLPPTPLRHMKRLFQEHPMRSFQKKRGVGPQLHFFFLRSRVFGVELVQLVCLSRAGKGGGE
jgi:hypothetical protein